MNGDMDIADRQLQLILAWIIFILARLMDIGDAVFTLAIVQKADETNLHNFA
jgi:hypothetical protein